MRRNNLNKPTASKETESNQEEMILILYNLLQKTKAREHVCPNLFYETSITLMLKPDKDI